MITTVIGSYPKPSYLQVPDWFKAKDGTDTANPTADYLDAISKMGDELNKALDIIEEGITSVSER